MRLLCANSQHLVAGIRHIHPRACLMSAIFSELAVLYRHNDDIDDRALAKDAI
jgi:purine nucleoside permease